MNYPYANGAIQAIDEKIFTKARLLKMLKIDPELFVETLVDVGYGSENSSNLEEIIVEELLRVKMLFAELSPQKKYTDLFFLANDALNIKAHLKEKIFNLGFDIFSPLGMISQVTLTRVLDDKEFVDFDKAYAMMFTALNLAIEGIDDARVLSAIVDQHIFGFIIKQGKYSKTLTTYFKALIDVINVKTIIRANQLHWDKEKVVEMILIGGNIAKDVIYALINLENDALVRRLYSIDEKLSVIVKNYVEKNNSQIFENEMDMYCIKAVAPYRYDSFDIGPIVYYYLKKQVEAKNIRIMYANPGLDGTELMDI